METVMPYRVNRARGLATPLVVMATAIAGGAPLTAEPAPAKVDAARVDAAVDKGMRYLLDKAKGGALPIQSPPHAPNLSTHELVFYALVHAGADPNHPDMQGMLKYLLDKKLERTYCVSLLAMGLSAFDRAKYQWRIAECADFLVNNQCQNGQWSYGTPLPIDSRRPKSLDTRVANPGAGAPKPPKALPKIPVAVRRRGPPTGDNSNSKFAAFGLRACAESGVLVDARVYEDALNGWMESRNADGGWAYGPANARPSYGSMTAGATASLSVLHYLLGRKRAKPEREVAAGLRWLGDHYTLEKNPEAEGENRAHHYYFLYALERTGAICDTEHLGSREWHPDGAAFLLSQQRDDGSWSGELGHPLADTCFAILFLRRATKALPKASPTFTK
jgi:hypothetical protein